MDVVRNFLKRYETKREEELSIEEYLDLCKRDPLTYATAAERMLAAIGEPEMVDTANKLAIIAHIDTLGAQVKEIKSNGRLALVPVGHWSSRFAEGRDARC